jgi:hypothetical protein
MFNIITERYTQHPLPVPSPLLIILVTHAGSAKQQRMTRSSQSKVPGNLSFNFISIMNKNSPFIIVPSKIKGLAAAPSASLYELSPLPDLLSVLPK